MTTEADPSPPRADRTLEHFLFDRLPFGLWGGAVILFLILMGGFYAVALAVDARLFTPSGWPSRVFALGAVMSVLPVLILTFERRSQLRDQVDARALEAIAPGAEARLAGPPLASDQRRSAAGSLIGAGAGLTSAILFFFTDLQGDIDRLIFSPAIWAVVLMIALFILFGRAVARSANTVAAIRDICAGDWTPDPLRRDRLFPFGRIALRDAFVWFSVSLLLFGLMSLGMSGYIIQAVFLAATIAGAATFYLQLTPPHRRIVQARDARLAQLRDRISDLGREAAAGNADAAALYLAAAHEEDRVRKSGEWPVDAPVTRRFILFGLGPVAAWALGAALDHFGARLLAALAASA